MHHPNSFLRRARIRGFTLIELLTVIAIIGILAAILIPVVGKVRQSARASQCLANLRQIGGMFHLFAQDNRDQFPYQITSAADGGLGWDYQLLSYAQAIGLQGEMHAALIGRTPPSVFACPSSEMLSRGSTQLSAYGANGTLLRAGNAATPRPRVRLGMIAEPSRTYLAADANQRAFGYNGRADYLAKVENDDTPNTAFRNNRTVLDRHSGRVGMVFADASVRALNPETEIAWGGTVAAGVDRQAPWGAP
jgi:prepilin-type N-terminal cleavage/methylation domain-containing protein/prepilin-type processing-associated H-X9-DG protein